MGLLDKLMFWRKDDPAEFEVEGCFTLPGAELDDAAGADCALPPAGEAADSEI